MRNNDHIFIRIETVQAIKVEDFTRGLKAIESQYSDFIKSKYEKVSEEDTSLFIQELGKGSIIAELTSHVPPILHAVGGINNIVSFVKHIKAVIEPIFNKNSVRSVVKDASDKDLENFLNTCETISKDPKGSVTIAAARYANKERQIAVELNFNNQQATLAVASISQEQKERSKKKQEEFKNQLMIFSQTTLDDPKTDKKSGDKAMIPSISTSSVNVSYVSNLAASKIKSQIKKDKRNPYLKGFLVDGFVMRVKGQIREYQVTNCNDIVPLNEAATPKKRKK